MMSHRFTVSVVLVSAFLGTSVARADLNDGLVGYWSFDEGEGSTVHDGSVNNNHGTVYGCQWVERRPGRWALSFNGIDNYVDVLDPSGLTFANQSVTYSLWATIAGNPDHYYSFCTLGDADEEVPPWGPRVLMEKSRSGFWSGRVHMQLRQGTAFHSATSDLTGSDLPKDTWMHFVGVVDWGQQTVSLYVNGILQQDVVPTLPFDLSTVSPLGLHFGRGQPPSSYHDGSLDEIRIYDRALSEIEIAALYALASVCGNGVCEAGETPCSCENDCDATGSTWVCGIAFEDLNANCEAEEHCECVPDTGEELADIEVSIGSATYMTLADGRFALELPAAGRYDIFARHNGQVLRQKDIEASPGRNDCDLLINNTLVDEMTVCTPEWSCGLSILAAIPLVGPIPCFGSAFLVGYCESAAEIEEHPIRAMLGGAQFLALFGWCVVEEVIPWSPAVDAYLALHECLESELFVALMLDCGQTDFGCKVRRWHEETGLPVPAQYSGGVSLSPVNIRLVDSLGGELTLNSEDAVVNTLGAASVLLRSSENAQAGLVFGSSDEITVEVLGRPEAGIVDTFDLIVFRTNADGSRHTVGFEDVPTSANGLARISVGTVVEGVLHVDADGDGIFELEKEPDEILDFIVSPADLNNDGHVTLDDFGILARCMASGPGVTSPPEGCDPVDFDSADLDVDGDVDLEDFGKFGLLFSL